MTPNALAAHREKTRLEMRARRARRTPEQKAVENAKANERALARYRDLTREERRLRGAKNHARERELLATATPEEKERRLARVRTRQKRSYDKNRAAAVESMRRRREGLPDHEKERRKEQARKRSAEWRAARTEQQKRELVAYQSKYMIERKKVDPAFRVMADIRGRLRHARDRRNDARTDSSTAEMLGCSWKDFAAFLESQFDAGMTWENKSHKTWHIDHLVPLAAFDLSIDAESRVASHYLNHRPARAAENLAKSSRMPKPESIPARLRDMCLALDPEFFKRPTYRRRASTVAAS
jgi:hypothetical protein